MITQIEWQGRTWSKGQGIGVARHFQNAEIESFATDGGSYRVRVRFWMSLKRDVVNVREIGDWLTEEQIAELSKTARAENKAGKAELQSVICGDAGILYDEFRQATDILQEISDPDLAYPPIQRAMDAIRIAIKQAEDAIATMNVEGLKEGIAAYEERLKAALAESV